MTKHSKKRYQKDGSVSRQSSDLRKLLNTNYLSLTNKTYVTGDLDFPILHCDTDIVPDYLALYDQPSYYFKTLNTGICFYRYDSTFDGIHGLFNAIYYDDKKLLNYYKQRFSDVKFIISPDYSQFGDFQKIENIYRIWKSRIVSLWFSLEMDTLVIPNATYTSEKTFPLYFCGLEQCSVLAFSTKGHIRSSKERLLLQEAVRYSVDHLPLKTIVVYSVCGNDETSLNLFRYALDQGVKVIIPDNSLRVQNRRRCQAK